MSLSVCIEGLMAEGRIHKGNAQEAERLYDLHFQQLKHRMPPMAAAAEASERAIKTLDAAHQQKIRAALMQAEAQSGWLVRRRAEVAEGKPFNASAAHREIQDLDLHRQAIRGQAYAMIDGLLSNHRRDFLGRVRNRSDLADVVDELHGNDTGDANAREIADGWRQTAEWLRSRFNAAGGAIAKLDSWALPQTHDSRALREAGVDAWKGFLMGDGESPGLLKRESMLDYETGLPLSDDRLSTMLDGMYETIATDGWNKADAGSIHAGSLANKGQQHRILHFANGDAWRAYADRFGGSATAFDSMISHVERMSRDIASMERLGPNPAASIRWQGDWLEKAAHTSMDQKAIDRAGGARGQLDRLYGEYAGSFSRPENKSIAIGFSILKAQQSAAKLGGAVLSSGGDFGTMITTAGFDGLPAAKMLGQYVKLMLPGSMEDRELAARLGLVSHEWTNASSAQWRYTGEEFSHEISRRVAESVLKASGLARHTEAAKMAFSMETLSFLTQMRSRDFSKLEPALQRTLQRYDIDQARWDMLRASPTREERGTNWFFPEDIAKGEGGQRLADDVMRMITGEVGYAVPEPDLRTRAMLNSLAPKGTWAGEIVRTAGLFKGFPLSVLMMHGGRMMELTGGERWKYGLTLAALTTLGGALSLQLKALAKGQDPQDMASMTSRGAPRFWSAAALQGGGLGIFGDLLGSSTDRVGGGFYRTLLGPAAQTVNNVNTLVAGNAVQAFKKYALNDPKAQPHFARDLVKTVEPEVPGLSLFYVRAAYQRLLGDFIAEWSNESYNRSYADAQRYAQEQGSGYWAPPGSVTGNGQPMRAPDWGNAIGKPAEPQMMH